MPDFSGLKTRTTPKQVRAQQRVRAILEAAVAILATRAPGDLSANAIAAEAAVPVSSIYRYFPCVDDVVDELYLQAADALRAGLEQAVAGPGGWRERLAAVLALLRRFLADHPYYRALLVLMAARRGPQSLDHDYNRDIAAFLSARWARGDDGFSGGTPEIVAATLVQMILSLEEMLVQQTDPAREVALFAEMARAAERYLELYLSDPSEPGRPEEAP